jgi:hypothetical protein
VHPVAAATVAALIVTSLYGAACYLRPYTTCSRCHGYGYVERRMGRGSRPCPRCRSTGQRLRAGRWVANKIIARHRAYLAATGVREDAR